MCEIQEEILKIITPFSSVYSKCQLKLCSLPRALEMFTWYLKYVHTEAGTIYCYTPSPRWGTGLEGGYLTLALLQNFISTSETLVQIAMWCYLEFVCCSYV